MVVAEFVFTEEGEAEAVTRWVENAFHRRVLMPGFRAWCREGCFGEYRLETDHERARRCTRCGRWTQELPGWDERRPETCGRCGAPLETLRVEEAKREEPASP